jgi:hypothetical protein
MAKPSKVKTAASVAAGTLNSSDSKAVNLSNFVAASMKEITFTSTNPMSLIGITAAHADEADFGKVTVELPVGEYSLFVRVQGTGPFTITVSGAVISAPIQSTDSDAFVRVIKVSV